MDLFNSDLCCSRTDCTSERQNINTEAISWISDVLRNVSKEKLGTMGIKSNIL